jgi:D-sedoheptulose 7-phosphate isomerase
MSKSYFELVSKFIPKNINEVNQIVEKIWVCILNGKSIWIIGNGGSASTANHLEVDLSFVRLGKLPYSIRVHSLCSNSALITAIGNDIGFEKIFSHQIDRLANSGDLCLAISASGNSQNLIEAFNICQSKSVETCAILGFDGGTLAGLSDTHFIVETEIGMYGPVEDIHLALCHYITSEIRRRLLGDLK